MISNFSDIITEINPPFQNPGSVLAFVEVTSSDIEANAHGNLLWILVRLHTTENQTIPGWNGFNIKVRDEEQVSQDNIAR